MRALVTGGTRGIGLAICNRLKSAGIDVFTFSRTGGDIQADGLFHVERRRVWEACGPVDILVNNLGGGGRWGPLEAELGGIELWMEVHQKNAGAAADFTAWALPGMMAKGWGRVVTIGSIHGLEAGGRPWFAATKAAEIGMMGAFARDPRFVRRGITFNTVCPGNVRTEGKPEMDMSHTPLGRMGLPSEVASVVNFLCSKESALINGACMAVAGGENNCF